MALFRRIVEDYEACLAPPSTMAQPHHARGYQRMQVEDLPFKGSSRQERTLRSRRS